MKTSLNKRTWLKAVLSTVVAIAVGGTAIAASVHFKSLPTFEDLGENLNTCLALAGLGNKDVTISVAVTGTASVTYYNPGGNKPAGQNKVPIAAVTTETIPSTQIKNGNVSVCLESPDIEVADAPNPNWTVDVTDVSFATATVTVVQKGKVVLKETFTIEN